MYPFSIPQLLLMIGILSKGLKLLFLYGKRITEGIATTPVTELFIVSGNIPGRKFSRDFVSLGLRNVQCFCGFCPLIMVLNHTVQDHTLGKVRALFCPITSRRQLREHTSDLIFFKSLNSIYSIQDFFFLGGG